MRTRGANSTRSIGHKGAIVGVSYSPDGTTVATASWDRTARLWDVNTGSELRTLDGHTDDVDSVAFGPDGNTIATGSKDGTVLVWETQSLHYGRCH